MKLRIVSPTKAEFVGSDQELSELKADLTYTNTAAQHLVKRHYQSVYFKRQNPDGWQQRLEELQKDVKHTLVFQEGKNFYIRPGSIPTLGVSVENVDNLINYPKPKAVAWHNKLPFALYDYQQDSVKKLIEEKHGNVELCTGAGKSAILLALCRETGFRTAIIAPSKSIFEELCEKFEHHFGKGMIGKFGNGKKVLGKRFTICIADSIANIVRGSKEWEFFSSLEAFAADESHTWGADSLDTICHGVLGAVPCRWFMSGTQTRGDGAEKLLFSIIGRTVHTLSTKEAIEGGFIGNHDFTIVSLESSNPSFYSKDALEMKRMHFLGNKNIAAFAAKLANASATTHRKQTLVLVEELSQIALLLPHLKVPIAIAHAEKKKERLEELGMVKSDPTAAVEAFNKGEAMVLIGTSCISTGTNIFANHNTVNWVGGSSEIKTKQGAVGRSVRKWSANPWKDKIEPKEICKIYDFDVWDIQTMKNHLQHRISFYEDSGTPIKYIKLKK